MVVLVKKEAQQKLSYGRIKGKLKKIDNLDVPSPLWPL